MDKNSSEGISLGQKSELAKLISDHFPQYNRDPEKLWDRLDQVTDQERRQVWAAYFHYLRTVQKALKIFKETNT